MEPRIKMSNFTAEVNVFTASTQSVLVSGTTLPLYYNFIG